MEPRKHFSRESSHFPSLGISSACCERLQKHFSVNAHHLIATLMCFLKPDAAPPRFTFRNQCGRKEKVYWAVSLPLAGYRRGGGGQGGILGRAGDSNSPPVMYRWRFTRFALIKPLSGSKVRADRAVPPVWGWARRTPDAHYTALYIPWISGLSSSGYLFTPVIALIYSFHLESLEAPRQVTKVALWPAAPTSHPILSYTLHTSPSLTALSYSLPSLSLNLSCPIQKWEEKTLIIVIIMMMRPST